MSRPLRLHVPGMLYHVVARGNNKARIFADDIDGDCFLGLLAEALSRFNIRCLAYCLLSNHYHLLLLVNEHPVSRMMQQLNSRYCQRFNRRHDRVGHVTQGRFGSRIVDHGAYTRAVLRYIALNPVAAGCVEDPSEWSWSSYRVTVSDGCVPHFLTLDGVWAAFGTTDPVIGRKRFASFVLGGLQEVFTNPLIYGSDRLGKCLVPLLQPYESTREYIYGQRFAARATLGTLFEGRRDLVALEDAAYAAFVRHAYTLAEIGATVGRAPSTVSRWIERAAHRQRQTSVNQDSRAKRKI